MNLRLRLFGPAEEFGFRRPGGRYQSTMFQYVTRQISAGFWQELCDAEFSYPSTHRPLVEFLFAIPIEQKARPGQSKSILRRALSDMLPVELLNRREPRISIWAAAVSALVRERARIREMFSDALSSDYGYLNAESILAACGQTGERPDGHVIALVPFEYWLRSVESRRAHSSLASPPTALSAEVHSRGLAVDGRQTTTGMIEMPLPPSTQASASGQG